MNFVVNGYNAFLILGACFVFSVFLIWIMRIVATGVGVVDAPNERKVHKKSVPLLGGIGIFLSFLLGYMIFGAKNDIMNSILIASFLVLLLGIFDDMTKSNNKKDIEGVSKKFEIKAGYKFLIHICIAAIIVFYGGLQLSQASIFGYTINFGIFAPYVSIIIIVAIINAMNLIDGLDGLCGGISSIYFATIAVIGFILNKFGGLDIMISVIMLGATLGYLVHNFPPAKIYQGDAGSTFIGLMISVIMLIGFKTLTLTSLIIPLLVLAIPIIDTLFAIIRRKLKHQPAMKPDKEHMHHQLLKMSKSTTKTILMIYAVDIIFSITSIFYTIGYKREMIICYVFILFFVGFLVLKTNIIFERKKAK